MRKIGIVVVVIFVLTLIAYPLLYSPKNLQPGVEGEEVDIEIETPIE